MAEILQYVHVYTFDKINQKQNRTMAQYFQFLPSQRLMVVNASHFLLNDSLRMLVL